MDELDPDAEKVRPDPGSEETVKHWFADQGGGTLQLPDGWFGRPWDNFHQLTWVALRPQRLIVEIDEQLMLTFAGAVKATTGVDDPGDEGGSPVAWLNFEGFSQLVFDRRDYGAEAWHAQVYAEGRVRFVHMLLPG
jgi:hypothetical protein